MADRRLTMRDYYPAPFWFLNHKLEKPELLLQLRLMREQGVRAFFLHPRAGLRIPYGSREWFELIRFTAVEADKLGMEAWLYDEDPFPSGPAGGRIFMEHPEFIARELNFRELLPDASGHVSADLGEGRLLEALAVRADDRGNVLESRDVGGEVGVLRTDFFRAPWYNPYYRHLAGRTKYFHYRAETFYPHLQLELDLPPRWRVYAVTADTAVSDSKYRWKPDNLNPECVREFMRWTHELYAERLGDLFGKAIPGIFTDETAAGGNFPWTPRFAAEFRARRGTEIAGCFHRIFRGDSPEAARLREAYWETVHELFIAAFFAPVNAWCEQHGLALCGHGIGEELPLVTATGMNIFNLQKYTGIPGFDHITPNLPDWTGFTSLNLGGKLVASAAEQSGKHRVMSECMGCNAYNFGIDGMKKEVAWLGGLGVNWAVPHGFHYSYDGFRKDDAGKSFFFQSPDYPRFHEFGNFAAELGWRLGESRSSADVCVLYPENTFRRLVPARMEEANARTEELYVCNQFLLRHQVQFEFADEVTLRNAEIRPGGFRCGNKTYRRLILPFPVEREYLKRFAEFIAPREAVLPERACRVLNAATGKEADTVIVQLRELAERRGKLLYFFHNSAAPGSFRIAAPFPEKYAGFIRLGAAAPPESFPADAVINLPPWGAAMLEFRAEPFADAPEYVPETPGKPDFAYLDRPEWDYIPPLSNIAATLRDWDFRSGGETAAARRYDVMKYIFGREIPHPKVTGPTAIFDQSPRRPAFYPAQVTAETRFDWDGAGTAELLYESATFSGRCDLFINDRPLPAPVRRRVYDPWNLVADLAGLLRPGTNVLRAEWTAAGPDDGVTSLLYILKK